MDMRDKRVLITGGSLGIGAAIATDLAKAGANIAINARKLGDETKAVVDEIQSLDRKGIAIAADMSVPDDVERCVQEAAESLGGLDVMVHSAGGPSNGSIEEVTLEQWRYAFAVHVDAAYLLAHYSLPHMKKNSEGAMLFISSAAGIRGCPGAITYGTVKGAIVQFTRALARELGDHNIRVNCLAPGIIRTRFHEAMTPEQQEHNLANRITIHREGTVQDVAEAARTMITNEFITGETLVVDGGMTMQIVR